MNGPRSIWLPEIIVSGKRLGRHIDHDPESLRYLVPETDAPSSTSWVRRVPIYDQGNVGSCTGNACAGVLGTDPFFPTLPTGFRDDETLAVQLYSAAERIDGGEGYPPEDQGSSGLSVAKAAKDAGLISGYQHATSIAAAQQAIKAGPFLVGSYWYDGMDSPDPGGLVAATGTVRGGHEYECFGYDATQGLWWFYNSWGPAWGLSGAFCYTTATFARLLADGGDATVPVPVTQPAPTPAPAPALVRAFTADQAAALEDFAAHPHRWRKATAGAQAWQSGTPVVGAVFR